MPEEGLRFAEGFEEVGLEVEGVEEDDGECEGGVEGEGVRG